MKRSQSPFTLKKKLFLGFGLMVITAFMYVNMAVVADPVTNFIRIKGDSLQVAPLSSLGTAKNDSDSLKALEKPFSGINDFIPEVNDVMSLPRIEIGPF